jgi:hypothetical protein
VLLDIKIKITNGNISIYSYYQLCVEVELIKVFPFREDLDGALFKLQKYDILKT